MLYSALKAAVADHLNRDDLTSQIGTFASLAVTKLEREQLYFLATNTTLTTVAAQSYLALPTGFIQEHRLGDKGRSSILNSAGRWVSRVRENEIVEYQTGSGGTGEPKYYAINSGRIEFYPIPAGVYNFKMHHFKSLGLPADNAENSWTTVAFDVLFFSILSEAWDYLGNTQELLKAEEKKDRLLSYLRSISGKILGYGQVRYNEV